MGTNYVITPTEQVVPPGQSVVYITNNLGGYTVSYNTALNTNTSPGIGTALRSLYITNGVGNVNELDVNAKLSIDTAGWAGNSNWFSPLIVDGKMVINAGGWVEVNATNSGSSSTTMTVGGRNAAGGLVVVNGANAQRLWPLQHGNK